MINAEKRDLREAFGQFTCDFTCPAAQIQNSVQVFEIGCREIGKVADGDIARIGSAKWIITLVCKYDVVIGLVFFGDQCFVDARSKRMNLRNILVITYCYINIWGIHTTEKRCGSITVG